MPAGPPPEEMRGRAAEIEDPGALGWEVVWEALKTEPPGEGAGTLTGEHSLGEEHEVRRPGADLPGTEFSGTRHGRPVALRIGVIAAGWRDRALNEVEVGGPVAPFRVSADGGRLVADPGAPAEVEQLLGELAPSKDVWNDVVVEGGPDGIVARRPVKAHSQGYVYDMWLCERLADRLGG